MSFSWNFFTIRTNNSNSDLSPQYRFLMGNFGIIQRFCTTAMLHDRSGEWWEEQKGGNLSSLFPLPSIPRALPFFPSPQVYGQETFTAKAARKRPLRRRENSNLFPQFTVGKDDVYPPYLSKHGAKRGGESKRSEPYSRLAIGRVSPGWYQVAIQSKQKYW